MSIVVSYVDCYNETIICRYVFVYFLANFLENILFMDINNIKKKLTLFELSQN